MKMRLERADRVRLAILLFALLLVTGLAKLSNAAPAGTQGGVMAALPGAPGASAAHGPASAAVPGLPAAAPAGGNAAGDASAGKPTGNGMVVGRSYKNDTSPPIR